MLFYGIFLALSIARIPSLSAEDRIDASVKRLSTQISKIFEEQTRFDLVEKVCFQIICFIS